MTLLSVPIKDVARLVHLLPADAGLRGMAAKFRAQQLKSHSSDRDSMMDDLELSTLYAELLAAIRTRFDSVAIEAAIGKLEKPIL